MKYAVKDFFVSVDLFTFTKDLFTFTKDLFTFTKDLFTFTKDTLYRIPYFPCSLEIWI